MAEIRIETGLQTYRLNDSVEVTFNPTDMAFGSRLYDVVDVLDKKQDEYKKAIEEKKDSAELFEYCRQLDEEMRQMMNGLFDKDIITPLIGHTNVYALADGMPIWANIIFALVDEMDVAVTENNKLSEQRVKKYTKKYQKKYHN